MANLRLKLTTYTKATYLDKEILTTSHKGLNGGKLSEA
jgi:hypothetical protein